MRKKIIWVAELQDGVTKECDTKKEALEAEELHQKKIRSRDLMDTFRKHFHIHFDQNDEHNRFLFPCVDCGIPLHEFECIFDTHRCERGEMTIYNKTRTLFLDGWRCGECDGKAIKLFHEMNSFYAHMAGEEKIIDTRKLSRPPRNTQEEIDILLHILEMVDFYNKYYENDTHHRKSKK